MFLHPTGKFDNSARAYRHIEVKPLAAAMGAEILRCAHRPETAAQFAEIEDALFRHKMIYFRGQQIGHAEHHAFSRRFGDFAEDAYTDGMPGFREVQPLIKEADDNSEHIFGSGWHTDSPFLPNRPRSPCCVRCRSRPSVATPCGPTRRWRYAMLSESMQRDDRRPQGALLHPRRARLRAGPCRAARQSRRPAGRDA